MIPNFTKMHKCHKVNTLVNKRHLYLRNLTMHSVEIHFLKQQHLQFTPNKMNKLVLALVIICLKGVFSEDDKYYFSYPLKVIFLIIFH